MLAITHYNRLLDELRPDHVHILVKGRIVASGGPELADQLEIDGYAAFVGQRRRARPAAPWPTFSGRPNGSNRRFGARAVDMTVRGHASPAAVGRSTASVQ